MKLAVWREQETGAITFDPIFSGYPTGPQHNPWSGPKTKGSVSITTIVAPEGSTVRDTDWGRMIRLPDSSGLNDAGAQLIDARTALRLARERLYGFRFPGES